MIALPRPRPEWVGKTPTAKIPADVKLRIVERGGGRCTGPCHRQFDAKLKPQFDHRPALANGGEHRESMIFAVCAECHSLRTKQDFAARALTKRIKKAHYGLKEKKPWPWTRLFKRKVGGTVVPRHR